MINSINAKNRIAKVGLRSRLKHYFVKIVIGLFWLGYLQSTYADNSPADLPERSIVIRLRKQIEFRQSENQQLHALLKFESD